MNLELTPQEQAEADRQTKEHDEVAADFGDTFRTPQGRKILKHLSVICNAHGSTVKNKTNPDANSVLFEEGKRMIYEYIMFYLRHDNERRKRTSI